MTSERSPSALELFHPTGHAPRVLVLGEGCPAGLLDGLATTRDAGHADIVVVAPTRSECRARGWLSSTARSAAARLDEDGVAFLLVPLPWRLRLRAAVRAEGLALGPAVLHLPDLASSRYLVTGGRAAVRYATACLVSRSSWRGRVASFAARIPGGTRLGALSDRASVVARRRGGEPLFQWLAEAAGQAVGADHVVVTRTWRVPASTSTLFVVEDDAVGPRLVARLGRDPSAARDQLGQEDALAAFATSARAAGAAVPRPLASSQLHGVPLLIETGVPGRVASSLLAERPHEVEAVLDRTLAWLLDWNRLTAADSSLTTAYLEQEVLAPARAVMPAVAAGAAQLERLKQLCAGVAGRRVRLTAAHDDLTMTNVLLRADGGLGVVDWGTARPAALPLVDFFYSVVDAYAASEQYRDRPRAFARCFANQAQPRTVQAHQAQFERAFGVERPIAELAFHACWLHHAANEVHRGEVDGPFVSIVRALAAHPRRFSPAGEPHAPSLS